MFFLIFSWLTWNSCHVFEFKFTLANQMHTPASKKKVSHRVLSIAYHTVANLVQLESRFVVTPSWYRTLSVLKFYFQSSWIADGCHRLYHYTLSLRIQLECGKVRIRKTPNTDTFHAVNTAFIFQYKQRIIVLFIILYAYIVANAFPIDFISLSEWKYVKPDEKQSELKTLSLGCCKGESRFNL